MKAGEDMEIPGVLKKGRARKVQGLIQKEVEFAGVFKKKSCGISMGLAF